MTLTKIEKQALTFGQEALEAYQAGRDEPTIPHGFCMCSHYEKTLIKWWLCGQSDSHS